MRLVIIVISSIVCYNIADDKGYKKREGAFRGAVFGIFAIIYYATLKRIEPKDKADIMFKK